MKTFYDPSHPKPRLGLPHGKGGESSPALTTIESFKTLVLCCTMCVLMVLWENVVVNGTVTVVEGGVDAEPNGRMEAAEKARMSETDRQEVSKKSPLVKETDPAGDRETETEIETVRTKMTKDAMVGKVPAKTLVFMYRFDSES